MDKEYNGELVNYIRIKEPKEPYKKQLYWDMAIGLNKVDGLTPSQYFTQLVNENVKGNINVKNVEDALNKYYKTQDMNSKEIFDEYECDLVSTRIVELLNSDGFSFRPISLQTIHQYLFRGIYNFAGKYRNYNIKKEEPILKGDTVIYASYSEIENTLEYDFRKEKEYDYSKLGIKEQIEHLADFTSRIWQVHPFGEGNTRTVAVMIERYLRLMGYDNNNDLFKEHSVYFRNALVRSNYANREKGIYPTNNYLIRFFENLLTDKENKLLNEELVIRYN